MIAQLGLDLRVKPSFCSTMLGQHLTVSDKHRHDIPLLTWSQALTYMVLHERLRSNDCRYAFFYLSMENHFYQASTAHLKEDGASFPSKEAKLPFCKSPLCGAEGVDRQHCKHAGEEDLPPQRL